jgi:hypothetical protein
MASINLTWAADNNQNEFISTDQTRLDWIENINNITKYNFKFVKYYKDSGLLIFDRDRNVHVLINNNQLKSGYSLDQLNPLYTGKWINLEENKSLSEHFRSPTNSTRLSPTTSGHQNGDDLNRTHNSQLSSRSLHSNAPSTNAAHESFNDLDLDEEDGVPADHDQSKLSSKN